MRAAWGLVPQRLRETVAVSAGLLAVVVLLELIPDSASGQRGTPAAILALGAVFGLVNGLTAAGIVLVYRTTRVLNFAQTAIGAGGAVLCFDLLNLLNAPFVLAFLLALLTSAALGAAFDIIFGRRFFKAPRLVLTVLTIVAAGFLSTTGQNMIDTLPIFPARSLRTIAQLEGNESLRSLLPAPNWTFYIGGLRYPFQFAEVFAAGCAVLAVVVLALLIRYTRIGVAVRALAENAERASLLGISVGLLSTAVWTTAGVLSGLSLTLTGLLGQPQDAFGFAPQLLLPSFAAAVVGRMRSLGTTVAAAVAIACVQEVVRFRQPDLVPLVSGLLLLVVALGLLLQGRRESRSELAVGSSWAATEEIRPIPKEMLALTGIRVVRWGFILVLVAAVVVFPFITDGSAQFLGSVVMLDAIVGLSLVVLTGWSGQVSLGQFGFAAIGAVVAAALTDKTGLTFWLAVPIASLVTAGVAVLVGLPALRIPGLFLAVATFAFAVAVHDILFNEHFFGWLLPSGSLPRPQLFLIDFSDDRWMYFLSAAALGLAIVAVLNLRRGRFGRVVIGVRDNDQNAESLAVDPVRIKLAAFGLAGLLAGFAGAISAFQQHTVLAAAFTPNASISAFVLAVIGGISSVWGPLLGSGYVNGLGFALSVVPDIAGALLSLAPLALLYWAPGGLLSLIAAARNAALRIVAQRNQLIVPSLFADVDPESLRLRLVPIAAPIAGSGSTATSRKYRIRGSALAAKRADVTVYNPAAEGAT